jgi:hypothetical protein
VFFEAYAGRLEGGGLALAESEPSAIQQPIDVAGERMFGAFHGSIIPGLKLVLTETILRNTVLTCPIFSAC